MYNSEIAKIFNEIALYLEMDNIPFKPQAYEKAAENLEILSEDIAEIYKSGGFEALEKISGIGKSMAEKIEEYLKTGKIKEYEALKKKMPIDLEALIGVEGIGPRKVKTLYQKLKIKNLSDLEKAARDHKIAPLDGFGEKTEQNILEGIEFLKRDKGRFLLGEIEPVVEEVIGKIKKIKEVKMISPAGSVRRKKETIGDVDILVSIKKTSQPAVAKAMAGKVMDFFVSLPGVVKIWGKGMTKSSVRMAGGFDMDIRVVPEKSFGSALQYFSGSKEHNIILRKIAIDKGLKLSEYGLFKGSKMIAGENEEGIYKKLGLKWIPPELRENSGEIEAALKNKLPKLVEPKDIFGDLHVHSNWNGGEDSMEELAQTAMKMGYEYIGISDHTKFLRIENGLDEKQLRERNKEIDKINSKFKIKNSKFRILKGCEANIMPDGSIDIDNKALSELDYVIAGVHSQLRMTKEEMTNRIIKAMENPHVDIISHPTGRIIKQREEYEFDLDKILEVARETKTVLEINSFPNRLDLKDTNIRKAKKAGVKMIINTDSHTKRTFSLMKYGIFQARRGWAEKGDIINCWPVEKMKSFLKKS